MKITRNKREKNDELTIAKNSRVQTPLQQNDKMKTEDTHIPDNIHKHI